MPTEKIYSEKSLQQYAYLQLMCFYLQVYTVILREEDVLEFIKECLQKNLALARGNDDKWNICKLFIHCYEVSIC